MTLDIQPWLYSFTPHPGESLSHFLGRFRQANGFTPSGLGQAAGIGAVVVRWERFYLNPFPTPIEIDKLALLVRLPASSVREMLPPLGVSLKLEPIRLCAVCYAEEPYHRLEWQFKSTAGCEHHGRRLLSECPHCKARFPIPSQWDGACRKCGLPFVEMIEYQKTY